MEKAEIEVVSERYHTAIKEALRMFGEYPFFGGAAVGIGGGVLCLLRVAGVL